MKKIDNIDDNHPTSYDPHGKVETDKEIIDVNKEFELCENSNSNSNSMLLTSCDKIYNIDEAISTYEVNNILKSCILYLEKNCNTYDFNLTELNNKRLSITPKADNNEIEITNGEENKLIYNELSTVDKNENHFSCSTEDDFVIVPYNIYPIEKIKLLYPIICYIPNTIYYLIVDAMSSKQYQKILDIYYSYSKMMDIYDKSYKTMIFMKFIFLLL